jgi:hypothetical protein
LGNFGRLKKANWQQKFEMAISMSEQWNYEGCKFKTKHASYKDRGERGIELPISKAFCLEPVKVGYSLSLL